MVPPTGRGQKGQILRCINLPASPRWVQMVYVCEAGRGVGDTNLQGHRFLESPEGTIGVSPAGIGGNGGSSGFY